MNRHFQAAAFGHLHRFALIAAVLAAPCGVAGGQAAAKHSGATSVSVTTTAADKPVLFPPLGKATGRKASHHLIIPTGPPQEVVNRRTLELRAGMDAGKLLLRSAPSAAQAWVNGAFVGKTPLLLILAPGTYQVEVRGQRLESARQTVDLLPRETRDIALQMAARYPTNVSIH
jgi:hypothetical protein